MKILIRWLSTSTAIYVASFLLPGVRVTSIWAALLTALVIGVLNTLVRPLLKLLSLPLLIVTFGLFSLIINGVIMALSAWLINGFSVDGFWWSVAAAFVVAVVSGIIDSILGANKP